MSYTTMTYAYDDRVVLKSKKVREFQHSRKLHTDTQSNAAAVNQGFANAAAARAAGGKICNHYIPYAGHRNQVKNWSEGKEIKTVLNTLKTDHDTITGTAITIPTLNMFDQYEREDINEFIDKYMHDCLNDPRNLFFWPAADTRGDAQGRQKDYPDNGTFNGENHANRTTTLANYGNKIEKQWWALP